MCNEPSAPQPPIPPDVQRTANYIVAGLGVFLLLGLGWAFSSCGQKKEAHAPTELLTSFAEAKAKLMPTYQGGVTDMKITEDGLTLAAYVSSDWYRLTPDVKRQFACTMRQVLMGLRAKHGLPANECSAYVLDSTNTQLARCNSTGPHLKE